MGLLSCENCARSLAAHSIPTHDRNMNKAARIQRWRGMLTVNPELGTEMAPLQQFSHAATGALRTSDACHSNGDPVPIIMVSHINAA
jgi:hypothetical protein